VVPATTGLGGRPARDEVVTALKADPAVLYVAKIAYGTWDYIPPDALYPQQWYLPKVRMPQAWDLAAGGSTSYIALVDSGVQTSPTNHPDLGVIAGKNFVDGSSNVNDVFGHGTRVAGIMAAFTGSVNGSIGIAGINYAAPILVAKIGDSAPDVDLAALGIEHAVQRGASAINASFGFRGLSDDDRRELKEAVDRAWSAGALVAVLLAATWLYMAVDLATASSPAPDPTPSYVRDEIIVRFREAPSATDLEAFERRHSLTFRSYAGLGKPRGLGWYRFRIDDGTDAAVVRDLLRSDPMVCYSTLIRLGTWLAVGPPEPDEERPCDDPPPSALPAASSPVASSPASDPADPTYVRDEILVRFREAPSATDLEIFTGRQFLTLVSYLGPDVPPGLGWYRFRIDDGMDAAVVRDLLSNDPMVCEAALIRLGTWDAVGSPAPNDELRCDLPPPSALPEAPTWGEAAAGGDPTTDGPSDAGQGAPAAGLSVLLLVPLLLVVGLGAWLKLRPRTSP
jgi:hypothetical protein